MDNSLNQLKSDYNPEKLSISLIKGIIKKSILEKNIFDTEIDDKLKALEKFDHFFQNNLIYKYIILKINKYFIFTRNIKNITMKEYVGNKEIILKNKIIYIISLIFLKENINNCNHYKIRKYIKLLLIFYLSGKISINDLFFIFEIIIISIVKLLIKNNKSLYQIFDINDKPLLFIKDIIETIINFPVLLIKNNILIESLINLFSKFFECLDKSNIILKESNLWLNLFENNSIEDSFEFYFDESYQKSIKIIIEFLKDIYKKNIPKKFYNEIYRKSSIDYIYYTNVLTMINNIIQKEIIKQKQVKIDKGIYLLGSYYIKEHLSFSSNEFSIILSFRLLNNAKELSIFSLIQNGKNIFRISIKNDCLNLGINNDLKWNTNIQIKTKIFYFIIITYNKKNKIIKLYINHDEILNKKTEEKKISLEMEIYMLF